MPNLMTDDQSKLKAGVCIYFGGDINPIDRLRFSNGTYCLDPDSILKLGYRPSAFVPQLPWQTPTADRLDLLLKHSLAKPLPPQNPLQGRIDIGTSDLAETIAIVKFPDQILSKLTELLRAGNEKYGSNNLTVDRINQQSNYVRAIDEISTYISKHYSLDDDTCCLGLNRAEVDKLTTTIDWINYLPQTPSVGLHLDSWEKLPLRRRHFSKQRLCLNIGTETRYFLFINRTLMQMFADLNLVDPTDISKDYRGLRIAEQFMSTCNRYPVISIAIEPGEAYIAPTENIIHDATSMDKQSPDWSLTFLGKFSLASNY
jgi:hypothetical protein